MPKLLRFSDWPLATKLIAAMVLITLLPLAVTSTLNYINTSTSLRAQIGDAFGQVAAGAANDISLTLVDQIHKIEVLAFNHDILQPLEESNNSYEGTQESIIAEIIRIDDEWREAPDSSTLIRYAISEHEAVNPAAHIMHDFIDLYPYHVEVFVTDMYGALIGSTGRTSDYYQADEGWWQAAWNDGEGGVYIGDPEYDESAGMTAVNIAVPVLDESGNVVGVLRTTYDIEAIQAIVSDVTVGETGHVTLVDRNGVVIADPHLEHVGETLTETILNLGLLETESAGWGEALDEDGVMAILSFNKATRTEGIQAIQDLNWTALASIESDEALAPVTSSTNLALLSGIIAIALAVAAAFLVARGLTTQVDHITRLFGEIGVGNFEARSEVTSGDELGQMAESLNAMLDSTLALIQTREERDAMQSSVTMLLDEVGGVAEGDLSVQAEVTDQITGAIADSFNLMIGQLRGIISDVQDATLQVSSSANEIRATTEHLSQGSEDQASQIADTSKAIEEMAGSIQQVSDDATTSAQVGEQALSTAQQGVLAVENTIEGMTRIRDQVQETAKRIKRLGESSQEIGEIVQLIGDIADRTSILALNASIQAAMAGEAGQGFAVVAEEVERLAERSTEATKQIDTLIRSIQNETNEAVSAMESTTNEVVEGSMLAEEAGHALSEIGNVSTRLSEFIQSISLASKQQARGSETLARSMSEIADVTQQTAAGTKQAAVSISNLAMLADELRASVSAFKLPGSNGNEPEK